MKKIALYDPYLNILGGGERYVLSILKVFAHHGYQPFIFWDSDLTKKIEDKFSLQFNIKLEFIPNIFKNKTFPSSTLKTLGTLRTFDYFIYVTNGSYFFSSAKKNYIYAMVPQQSLYSIDLINRLKTSNYTFITHSRFTKNHLANLGIQTKLLYPYIDIIDISDITSIPKKAKIILCVGRFFKHLHSKRHDIAIKIFLLLKKSLEFGDYRLIIAGGLQKEDQSYFNYLKSLAKNDSSIIFKPNIDFSELYKIYKLSTFYWHFAGFGVDENKHPELVEHMGITPIEAMASCCITFCYNAGGSKELIKDGENGFLFNTEKELMAKMELSIKNQELRNRIIYNAKKYVKENFSYEVFEKGVKEIFIIKY